MNEDKNTNVSNSFSDNDNICLEEIKNKINKNEKQIDEILVQVQTLTESVKSIEKKIEDKPHSQEHEQEQKNEKNILVEPLQDVQNESGKYKAKRYKENEKGKNKEIKVKKENKSVKTNKKKFGWIGEAIFYSVLVAMVLGAFLIRSNSSGGQPISIAGYSFLTVLTGSMQSEIPQGSLVVTKNVDPESLQIGDDITYMANQNATVTHRIISIVEEYQDTGERAFETKGVMNERPDKNLVPAVNVIGKVVYHNKLLGQIATWVGSNWIFLIFVVIVIFIFINVLKTVLKKDD